MSTESVADRFASLWDRWSDEWTLGGIESWLADPAVDAQLTAAQAAIEAAEPGDLGPIPAEPREAFVQAYAADSALAWIHPRHRDGTPPPASLAEDDARWMRSGVLSNQGGGAVLLRWVTAGRPGAPDAVRDVFATVTRVDPQTWRRVRMHRVADLHDLSADHWAASGRPQAGCLPFADALTDFEITSTGRQERRWYRVAPGAPLRDRPKQALIALDESGSTIGLLPEGVLDDGLVDRWVDALRTTTGSGRLRWVLAGTGPLRASSANAALIFDRDTAEVIGEPQGKRSRFNLRAEDVERWQLPLPAEEHSEDVEPDRHIRVLESWSGRYVVQICEDLTRSAAASLLEDLGPSHILVPIFSTEIGADRWEARGAYSRALNIGATVVVSNSLAVPRARLDAGKTRGPLNTALLQRASDGDYPNDSEVEAAAAWDRPVVFDLIG